MRNPNWRSELAVYVESVAREPFRYGSHDCALFVAGAVKAMTGEDHARGWRGKYRSLKRAQVVLGQKGYADHVAMVADHLEEIPPLMARVGDVAVLVSEGGFVLSIVQGAHVWAVTPAGIETRPLTDVVRAFRV